MTHSEIDVKKGANPVLAMQCLLQGLAWLKKPELRKFVVIPIVINLVIYVTFFSLGMVYLSDLIASFIPGWLSWLEWILWPLLFLSFLITGYFTFTLFANLIATPFYGKLAEKTLSLSKGAAVAPAEQPWSKVIFSELRRLGYLGIRALPLLLLFVIPGINLLAPFLWVLFSAWGIVLEYMAYPLENEGLLFPEQRQLLKRIRLGALSFGGIVVLGLTIPVLNILVPPAAVIAATLYMEKIRKVQ
ncbi:sulfate transporter CysZ [Thiolapillus sp.]|uniref:sulfate transporter CysZ n=1 Tax=Thiolapillus sp. TaxID=2017437 RepID=UPI003AF74296